MTEEFSFVKFELRRLIGSIDKNRKMIYKLLGELAAKIDSGNKITFHTPYLIATLFEDIVRDLSLLKNIFEITTTQPLILPISQEEISRLDKIEIRLVPEEDDLADLIELMSEAPLSVLDLIRVSDMEVVQSLFGQLAFLKPFETTFELLDEYLEEN